MNIIRACYHCGDTVPDGTHFSVVIFDQPQPMCCPGCQAVAQTIVDSGLTSYYQYRTATAEKADLILAELSALQHYDIDEVQAEFVHQHEGMSDVSLSLDNVTCAACAWLIEKHLSKIAGVSQIQVNATAQRARLKWDNERVKLSTLLLSLQQLGYQAAPFEIAQHEQQYRNAMNSYLRKLGVAGLASMQVMMVAVALYLEIFSDLDATQRWYFRWVSLIMSTPVILYSSLPFYYSAWRSLKARTLNMDVPVSFALIGAYIASAYATVADKGEVYFESITMFAFFLLLGRFLEMRVRRIATEATSNLLKFIPTIATLESGEQVAAKSLQPNDIIIIRPGEPIPADAKIVSGSSDINESMLTGEHLPVTKHPQDCIYTGTINGEGNLLAQVTHTGPDSLIAAILRLQDQALQTKPAIVLLADQIARYFVWALLLIAGLTWFGWHLYQPEKAFWVTLSVLVATCPCALALATPTAVTCVISRMSQNGLLIRKSHVLETLCQVNCVAMDKTGTLTEGNMVCVETTLYPLTEKTSSLEGSRLTSVSSDSALSQHNNDYWTEERAFAYAAALEAHSAHPIARLFQRAMIKTTETGSDVHDSLTANQIKTFTGNGLSGVINGETYRIGHRAFIEQYTEFPASVEITNNIMHTKHGDLPIYLANSQQVIACFWLQDPIRATAKSCLSHLHHHRIHVHVLTGDPSTAADNVAQQLSIDHCAKGLSPAEKLHYLQQKQQQGNVVMMIGDGVNDAPVLAGAHISVAMGGGTELAKNAADVVLLSDNLSKIPFAIELAKRTRKIIRENLAWALGYNLVILPLAISGMLPPYIAAIGMSASSLIVVVNSLRLTR
ncbi:MAG: heavy metal translocating P-type ATPase [Plesiomonas sp.]|uniref:heavy metal translocating P-type ATPase n=1 Tax=Plesiomonas sp. TaxID=2486279 RepID=UPI003F2FB8D1